MLKLVTHAHTHTQCTMLGLMLAALHLLYTGMSSYVNTNYILSHNIFIIGMEFLHSVTLIQCMPVSLGNCMIPAITSNATIIHFTKVVKCDNIL